eukprot:1116461_1
MSRFDDIDRVRSRLNGQEEKRFLLELKKKLYLLANRVENDTDTGGGSGEEKSECDNILVDDRVNVYGTNGNGKTLDIFLEICADKMRNHDKAKSTELCLLANRVNDYYTRKAKKEDKRIGTDDILGGVGNIAGDNKRASRTTRHGISSNATRDRSDMTSEFRRYIQATYRSLTGELDPQEAMASQTFMFLWIGMLLIFVIAICVSFRVQTCASATASHSLREMNQRINLTHRRNLSLH